MRAPLHQQSEPRDGGVVRPALPADIRDGLPEHLHIVAYGPDDFFLLCEEHGPASLIDSLEATRRAECPGCAAQRELAWIALRNRLRIS